MEYACPWCKFRKRKDLICPFIEKCTLDKAMPCVTVEKNAQVYSKVE